MPFLKESDVDRYAANDVVLIILKRNIVINEHRSHAPHSKGVGLRCCAVKII